MFPRGTSVICTVLGLLEDETYRLSRNVSTELPLYAV